LNNVLSSISKAERMGISMFLAFSIVSLMAFVGMLAGVISQLSEYPQPEPVVWVLQILITMILFLCGVVPGIMALGKVVRSSNPQRSRAWKRLVQANEVNEFVSSIDGELSDVTTLSHHDDVFRFLRFWLTPSWLILVSERATVIHRRARLVRVYLKIPPISTSSSRSRFAEHIYFQFDDGTSIDTRCGPDNHAKIMTIIKQAMPNAAK